MDRGMNIITERDNLVVANNFKFRGVSYQKGDSFDWKRIGCDWRKVLLLAGSRKVTAGGSTSPTKERVSNEKTKVKKAKQRRRRTES